MNRFDRVTALLVQLQAKRMVKGPELAQRFGVSLRTIYRDLRTLEEAGVPICGEPGVGYSLAEGYRLPPVMFTREEAAALFTADKLVAQLTDAQTALHSRTALEKLRDDTTVVHSGSRATAHLWIESPTAQVESEGRLSKWNRLFDTHPPIEERIAFLREL